MCKCLQKEFKFKIGQLLFLKVFIYIDVYFFFQYLVCYEIFIMKDKNCCCVLCLFNVKEEFFLKNLILDYDVLVDFVKLQVMNLSNYLVVFKNMW